MAGFWYPHRWIWPKKYQEENVLGEQPPENLGESFLVAQKLLYIYFINITLESIQNFEASLRASFFSTNQNLKKNPNESESHFCSGYELLSLKFLRASQQQKNVYAFHPNVLIKDLGRYHSQITQS